jgi:hypothetical protein
MAVASYLKSLRDRNVKKTLDAVYATEESVLVRLQREAVGQEEW